jgi:hypothetical protein
VPGSLRHMAKIASIHGYPFETIRPLLQYLNNARRAEENFCRPDGCEWEPRRSVGWCL